MKMKYLWKIIRENGANTKGIKEVEVTGPAEAHALIADWNHLGDLYKTFPKWKYKFWKLVKS